jgi:hypothetical protein
MLYAHRRFRPTVSRAHRRRRFLHLNVTSVGVEVLPSRPLRSDIRVTLIAAASGFLHRVWWGGGGRLRAGSRGSLNMMWRDVQWGTVFSLLCRYR